MGLVSPAIPPLYCPLPLKVNPAAAWEHLDENTLDWMARTGMFDGHLKDRARIALSDIAAFTVRVHPHASVERLQWAADYHSWYTHLDDDLERCPLPEVIRRMVYVCRVFDGQVAADYPDDRFLRAGRDLRRRVAEVAGDAAAYALGTALHSYAFGQAWENTHVAKGTAPALSDYLTVFVYSRGGQMNTTVIPFVGGFELRPRDLHHPQVRAARELTGSLVLLDNDLFSYRKEHRASRPTHSNIIDVLMRERGHGPEQAMAEAVRLHERFMCLYVELGDRIRAWAGEELRRYVDDLQYSVRGSIDWHTVSRRYRDPRDPAATEDVQVTSHLDRPSLEPLPVPAVSWWWDQLR